MESNFKAAVWVPLLQQAYLAAPPTGTTCPAKGWNLCLLLLAQKSDALNSPLIFFLTTHALDDFGDECAVLGCPALLPWAPGAALCMDEAARGGGEHAMDLHDQLLGLQFPS